MIREDGRVCLNEDGSENTKIVTRFHLHWSKVNFDQSTDFYITKPGKLDPEDQPSCDKLVESANSFTLAQWVTRTGKVVLDEQGYAI